MCGSTTTPQLIGKANNVSRSFRRLALFASRPETDDDDRRCAGLGSDVRPTKCRPGPGPTELVR